MPIRKNSYFNDPGLAQIGANLADLFAPPSGADAAGWAAANAENAKARRLSDFYTKALDPKTTREELDRYGVGAGSFNPSQSYYSVDQGNATQRYGYDRSYQSSTENNVRDNARSLQEIQMGVDKDILTAIMTPVAKDATRFIPPEVAEKYELPAQQFGNIDVGQGQTVVTPDGRTIEGAKAPLSVDQWRAQQLEEKRRSGDQRIEDIIMNGSSGSDKSFDNVSGLRKEVQSLPSYKNLAQALPIYRSMFETAGRDTKASDLNLVYGLGKIMDPTSVVREGEMVMDSNTSALPDWVQGANNSVNGGSKLTPETRQALMREAFGRVKGYDQAFNSDAEMYRGIVARNRLNPLDVIPNFGEYDEWKIPESANVDFPAANGQSSATPSPGNAEPVKVNSPEEARKLPSGTKIMLPDGRIGKVP